MKGTVIAAFLAAFVFNIQARSLVEDLGPTHHRHKRSDEEAWHPTDGRSSEEWYRCHGMPCDQWQSMKNKMAAYFRPPQEYMNGTGDNINGAFDGISYNVEDGTLDGCIWLTNEQADDIISSMRKDREEAETSDHGGRFKRKLASFSSSSYSKWQKFPITYKFDGQHTGLERRIIRNAFQSWQDETCITFKEVSANQVVLDNHILLTRNNTGCHSYVGRTYFKPQQLNLQHSCLWEFGIAVHEIGHTLGLWHEQQRADRDSAIRILWQNLGYYRGQFASVNTDSLGVPYDYGSVMHYAPKDGSSNGGNTMEAIDPLYQKNMGQKTGLSYLDAMIINRAYCQNVCKYSLSQRCEHFGYQDPKDCSRCRCPPGFSGRFCQQVEPSRGSEQCGGTLYATTSPQEFTSPSYDNAKRSYDNRQSCNWLIKAPHGMHVQLKFKDDFAVYCHNQGQCYHWVEVRYSQELGIPGPRFCCYKTPTAVMTSETRDMAVVFRSNWTASYRSARRGFKAVYVAVSDGTHPTDPTTQRTTTTTTPAPTTTPNTGSGSLEWSCDFEGEQGSWCSISQAYNDDFDWTLTNKGTPSDETGPRYAHDGSYYIFIEASNPRKSGDKAVIFLPSLKSGQYCVRFAYHMHGFHINRLQLFREDYLRQRRELWARQGQRGDRWITESVSVNLRYLDKLGFEAERGAEFSGDIALDSLRIQSGSC